MLQSNIAVLPSARFNSAERVLSLLRENTPTALALAEALVGQPIKRYPPARATQYGALDILYALASRLPPPKLRSDDLVVLQVLPRPYKKRCRDTGAPRAAFASKSYDLFAPGLTLAQLMARGATRRAINRARAEGWLIVGSRN